MLSVRSVAKRQVERLVEHLITRPLLPVLAGWLTGGGRRCGRTCRSTLGSASPSCRQCSCHSPGDRGSRTCRRRSSGPRHSPSCCCSPRALQLKGRQFKYVNLATRCCKLYLVWQQHNFLLTSLALFTNLYRLILKLTFTVHFIVKVIK